MPDNCCRPRLGDSVQPQRPSWKGERRPWLGAWGRETLWIWHDSARETKGLHQGKFGMESRKMGILKEQFGISRAYIGLMKHSIFWSGFLSSGAWGINIFDAFPSSITGGFHSHGGYPKIYDWDNPNLTWMMTGGTPIYGNPRFGGQCANGAWFPRTLPRSWRNEGGDGRRPEAVPRPWQGRFLVETSNPWGVINS